MSVRITIESGNLIKGLCLRFLSLKFLIFSDFFTSLNFIFLFFCLSSFHLLVAAIFKFLHWKKNLISAFGNIAYEMSLPSMHTLLFFRAKFIWYFLRIDLIFFSLAIIETIESISVVCKFILFNLLIFNLLKIFRKKIILFFGLFYNIKKAAYL